MERDLGGVVDALPGLVWTALPDGRADFINRRWCDYTGLSPDEALGYGWHAVVHPEDAPQLLERWGAFLATGQPGEVEARLRRSDGEYRWFLFGASPITDGSGAIVKWCGINTDIDDRRRAEQSLKLREQHYRSVADSIPAQIAFMTSAGEVESVNSHVLDYVGATLEELKSWPANETVHPDDIGSVNTAWARAVATGEPYEIEHRIRRADGVYRWFLVRALPLMDPDGNVVRWYCLQTDIDELKHAERLLTGEKRLLEMVARGRSLFDVLEALCRIVEDAASGCLCSILSIDPDGARFRHGAGPSLPLAYNEVLDGLVMDHQYGPCGMAANWKTQVIAADVASDVRWAASPWPALVLGHGLRACWSTPILSGDDRVIGVFALYQRAPSSPTALERDLIEQFAHIASIAIERAQSDASLRQSEARKSAILDSALDCIVTMDHQGRLTEFNPAAERTFGYRRDQVLGSPLADVIIPPSLRQKHRDGLARYLATDETGVIGRRIELTALRADGSEVPVELAITRIAADGPPAFTGYLRDITERRRSDEALRRSNAYLAEAQHISATGSFAWRVAADEITWSEQVYHMFEYDPAEPVTLEMLGARVHPEDLPLLADMIDRARRGLSDLEYEHRAVMPDGSIKWLHLLAHGSTDQHGEIEYIGAVHDITERRQSEEALGKVRSELAHMARVTSLGVLTASIAHEVNQPLSGIITNASTCLRMLAADPPNIAGASETARRTIRDGNRASDVIKRLRALFGKTGPATEAVDLNDAAREVIALAATELQRSQANLVLELDPNLADVVGDRVQLQQVILNLLMNASDAVTGVYGRPRRIVIRTQADEDDRVRLSVRDSGVGFDTDGAEKLFEAFHTTKSAGMGIGLSVSRSIIESHSGRLWASANDGPGATFAFSVPTKPADASDGDGAGAGPSAADARRLERKA